MDLLFVRLLAAGAVTARGTEEAPELAHHVREGRIVAWYGWSGQHLRQGVQHLCLVVVVVVVDVGVVTEVDVVDVVVRGCEGVLLSTHHLLLTTRTENRPGDLSLSLSLSLRKIVSWTQPGVRSCVSDVAVLV